MRFAHWRRLQQKACESEPLEDDVNDDEELQSKLQAYHAVMDMNMSIASEQDQYWIYPLFGVLGVFGALVE